MYQCRTPPLKAAKRGRIVTKAHAFIREWRTESPGSRPYVRVKFLGRGKQRVFIDTFQKHIEEKTDREMMRRYPLLPCVKELLTKTTDAPTRTKDGNLMLEGMTPDGMTFKTILRLGKRGLCLWSFYPD